MAVLDWHQTKHETPSDGDVVYAMDSGGHVQALLYTNNLWCLPDRSMYVYYTPVFWKEIS